MNIPLSLFTQIDDLMTRVARIPEPAPFDAVALIERSYVETRLMDLCARAMGREWCGDFPGAVDAAAMIVAMALLKQIEIVEE